MIRDLRRRRIRWAALAALVALTFSAGAVFSWWQERRTPVAPGPAEQFFALSMPDADGKRQAFAQWRGRILVVNFWATWCTPCVAEMPELQKVQDEYSGRGVSIVAVGTETIERVRQFRDQLGLRMVLLAGGFDSMVIARNLGDNEGVLPYTAVFSASGAVLHTKVGVLQPGQLQGWLDASVKTQAAAPRAGAGS